MKQATHLPLRTKGMEKSYTLKALAEHTQAELVGDPEYCVSGVEDLESAAPHQVSFLENPRYEKYLALSHAGVVFVSALPEGGEKKNYLVHPNPSSAFQRVVELFLSPAPSGFTGIHPTAVVHPDASLGEGVTIGPYAVIDRGVTIGDRSVIGPHVFIGAESRLGKEVFCHTHAVVRERCILGDRVILQPGAVVGACGFGYITDHQGTNRKLAQLGVVILEEDVEIGAHTTIARGRFKPTLVRRGAKLDSLIQIAHHVEVGEHNLIAAQAGIAGSTKTGRNVVIGGQVGIAGHLSIAAYVMLAARAGVSKNIEKGGVYSGAPAMPIHTFNRYAAQLRLVGKLLERMKTVERTLFSKTED